MLILTRKKNDAIIITTESGEKIRIIFVETGNKIRVGFEANKNITILREELLK